MPLPGAMGINSHRRIVSVLFSVFDTDNLTVNTPPPDALDLVDSIVSTDGLRAAAPNAAANAPSLTGDVPGELAIAFTAADNLVDTSKLSGNIRSFIIMTGPLGASTARTWIERTGFRIYGS